MNQVFTSNLQPISPKNKRVIGLDIVRIALALVIFLFHSNVHLDCRYGALTDLVSVSHTIAMTGFFMLSGYSLQVAYGQKELDDKLSVLMFYKKRLIAIYPLYIICGSTFVLMCIVYGKQSIIDNLLLLPIELLGVQSFFAGSLFKYSHNSGTWFVSCLLVCYAFYPLLKSVIQKASRRWLVVIALLVWVFLSYFPFVSEKFEAGSMYTNPFIRACEFSLGALLARINSIQSNRNFFFFQSGWFLLFFSLMFLYLESRLCFYQIYRDWLTQAGLSIILIISGSLKYSFLANNKAVLYISSLTYAFFLGQFFVWNPMKVLLMYVDLSNVQIIVISFFACYVVSVILHHLVEDRIGKYLRSKYL